MRRARLQDKNIVNQIQVVAYDNNQENLAKANHRIEEEWELKINKDKTTPV